MVTGAEGATRHTYQSFFCCSFGHPTDATHPSKRNPQNWATHKTRHLQALDFIGDDAFSQYFVELKRPKRIVKSHRVVVSLAIYIIYIYSIHTYVQTDSRYISVPPRVSFGDWRPGAQILET